MKDTLYGITNVPIEITHKIWCPYKERLVSYTEENFREHLNLNLRASKRRQTALWPVYCRVDYRLAPNQWETSLKCNAVSYWLRANLESALYCLSMGVVFYALWYVGTPSTNEKRHYISNNFWQWFILQYIIYRNEPSLLQFYCIMVIEVDCRLSIFKQLCTYTITCIYVTCDMYHSKQIFAILPILSLLLVPNVGKDQCRYAPSLWETPLQYNDVSHWLSAYLDWSLRWNIDRPRCSPWWHRSNYQIQIKCICGIKPQNHSFGMIRSQNGRYNKKSHLILRYGRLYVQCGAWMVSNYMGRYTKNNTPSYFRKIQYMFQTPKHCL